MQSQWRRSLWQSTATFRSDFETSRSLDLDPSRRGADNMARTLFQLAHAGPPPERDQRLPPHQCGGSVRPLGFSISGSEAGCPFSPPKFDVSLRPQLGRLPTVRFWPTKWDKLPFSFRPHCGQKPSGSHGNNHRADKARAPVIW